MNARHGSRRASSIASSAAYRPIPATSSVRCSTSAAYPGGRPGLVRVRPRVRAGAPGAGTVTQHPPLSFLPAPIEWNGMPNMRFWQFEDRKTNFGGIRASTTDLALLMLAEFGAHLRQRLARLAVRPARRLARQDPRHSRDRRIRRAHLGADRRITTLGCLAALACLQPAERAGRCSRFGDAAAAGARGAARGHADRSGHAHTRRMANMVFAIEETIPGALGTGVSGAEAAPPSSVICAQARPRTPGRRTRRMLASGTWPARRCPSAGSRSCRSRSPRSRATSGSNAAAWRARSRAHQVRPSRRAATSCESVSTYARNAVLHRGGRSPARWHQDRARLPAHSMVRRARVSVARPVQELRPRPRR